MKPQNGGAHTSTNSHTQGWNIWLHLVKVDLSPSNGTPGVSYSFPRCANVLYVWWWTWTDPNNKPSECRVRKDESKMSDSESYIVYNSQRQATPHPHWLQHQSKGGSCFPKVRPSRPLLLSTTPEHFLQNPSPLSAAQGTQDNVTANVLPTPDNTNVTPALPGFINVPRYYYNFSFFFFFFKRESTAAKCSRTSLCCHRCGTLPTLCHTSLHH